MSDSWLRFLLRLYVYVHRRRNKEDVLSSLQRTQMRFYRNCVWSDVNQIYAAMMSPRPAARTSIDIDGLKIKDPDGDALAHLTLLICSFYRRSARYVTKDVRMYL